MLMYLILVVQFGVFLDPLAILVSLPLSEPAWLNAARAQADWRLAAELSRSDCWGCRRSKHLSRS